MTLTKGFLNNGFKFKPANLIGGLILWLTWSYILYAFFQSFREAFRVFTSSYGVESLLVLTSREIYFYNLFFAGISSAVGYGFALKFLLENSKFRQGWRNRMVIRRTLNDQDSFTWNFLYWFGRTGSVLGIVYLSFPIQYDLEFLEEYPILFLLLPLVLFYSTWPMMSRLVKAEKCNWFLGSSGLFVLMSLILAFINFMPYQEINKKLLSRSIEYVYDLQVPDSQSQQSIQRRSLVMNMYVVLDTAVSGQPVIFFGGIDYHISFSDLDKAIGGELNKIFELERYAFTVNLHIDRRIEMHFVNEICEVIRKAGVRRIQYSTGRKYSHYPSTYPPFKYLGIQKLLPVYYPELTSFLDSIDKVDLKGYAIKLPESLLYRKLDIESHNRIEINVSSQQPTVNGTQVSIDKLERLVYQFANKYAPNYLFILNVDDDCSYEQYITILDILFTQVGRLRNNFSWKAYNHSYDYDEWETGMESIRWQYPIYILEWSPEERRLNDLIKRINNNQ